MAPLFPRLITIFSAEIIFILVRSSDILIMFKSSKQRTSLEHIKIQRGLRRSVIVEGVLFVPLSTVLLILLAPLLMSTRLKDTGAPASAISAILGVVSYGFPFASVRRLVTVVALNTLREFASVLPKEVTVDHDRPGGEPQ